MISAEWGHFDGRNSNAGYSVAHFAFLRVFRRFMGWVKERHSRTIKREIGANKRELEQQRKSLEREQKIYENFMAYDGSEQPRLDA
jgi:hypothetical protein